MADKLGTQCSLHGWSYSVKHIHCCMKPLGRFTNGVFPNNRLEKRYKFQHRVFNLL